MNRRAIKLQPSPDLPVPMRVSWQRMAISLALVGFTGLGASYAATPSPTGDVGLTLGEAINRAVNVSPQVRGAEADRDAQVERRRGATSDLGPRVSVDYTQARYRDAQKFSISPQAPAILMRPQEVRTGSLTVAQPITGLYALTEKLRFESAQEDLKNATLKLTKADVAFSGAEAWLQAYQAQRLLAIAEQSVAAAQSQRKDGAALERAGRLNHGDLLKLDLAVSEAQARAAQARAGRDIALAGLKQAINLPLDAPLTLADALPTLPTQVPDLSTALREALDKRLEAQQAKAGVEVAGFGTKLAYARFTPSVNLFYKWDHSFSPPSALSGEENNKYYGIQATWEIWNNGSHFFGVREAAENNAKAEAQKEGVENFIRLDVNRALASLRSAQEQVALSSVAVKQAEEAYRIEVARFRSGAKTATDVILMETSQASARGRQVAAQTDAVLWNLKTQKALGVELPRL